MRPRFSIILFVAISNIFVPNDAGEESQGKHRLLGLVPASWLPSGFEYVPWMPFLPIYKPFVDAIVAWIERTTDSLYKINRVAYNGPCGTQALDHRQNLFSNLRIVGGRNAAKHSWPWMAYLEYFDHGKVKHTCGGSLIRVKEGDTQSDIVVTAAQCVTQNVFGVPHLLFPSNIRVTLGQHKRIAIYEYGRRVIKAKEAAPHKDYNPLTHLHDIALVKLETPVDFSDTIRPICLPESRLPDLTNAEDDDDNEQEPKPDKGWNPLNWFNQKQGDSVDHNRPMCAVTGWGSRKNSGKMSPSWQLQQLQVKIRQPSKCKKDKWNKGWGDKYVEADMICTSTSAKVGNQNAALGDAGDPLTCLVDNKWTLCGVFIFGRTGTTLGMLGKPDVFAKISKHEYLTWINQNKIHLSSLRPPPHNWGWQGNDYISKKK